MLVFKRREISVVFLCFYTRALLKAAHTLLFPNSFTFREEAQIIRVG
jgi:hypothetical protein